MIAAIYARKSTEQNGVADEAKCQASSGTSLANAHASQVESQALEVVRAARQVLT